MFRSFFRLCTFSLAFAALAFPANVNMGYASFDVTFAPNVGQVDIVNATGPNSTTFPDLTFPVTNSVSLTNLSLVVNFQSGPPTTFGPGSGYFTLNADGLSFDGNPSFNIALNPVTSAVLTGTFSTTSLTLNDGTTVTINPTFSTTISNVSGILKDGDVAVIVATTATGVVPEPSTFLLLPGGLALLFFARRRSTRKAVTSAAVLAVALVAALPGTVQAVTVRLNAATSPGSGVAGNTQVWVAGSGFPALPIPAANITVTVAASCGGPAVGTAPALAVNNVIGSTDRIQFLVPGTLATGSYYVSVSGSSAAAVPITSGNCSLIQVTKSSTVFGSCNPGSSMGLLVPAPVVGAVAPVTAYIPNSSWTNSGLGVQAVPLEGPGAAVSIPTTDFINSCSTNSVTGVSVCTANGSTAQVYLISGTSVTSKVKSASNATASFSGGSCFNCGVAVNSITNQAVISMGYTPSTSTSALQFLDLNTNTFGPPVPTRNIVSEDLLWDPFLNLVLSPNELNIYSLYQISGAGTPGPSSVAETARSITGAAGEANSAGEDCSTGIAITVEEFTGQVYLADLKQATFTPGTPGSWTAPSAIYNLTEFGALSAGASAVAVAPGSTHLGVVAGEFGGSAIGIIQLPATSGPGAGTPVIVDYVLANLPATPDGLAFQNGFDPHTTTAYTSPNNNNAYGVAASWPTGKPSYVAVIDLKAALAAPRTGAHTISSAVNLLTTGIVRYVKAF
jgi:hypothetical protein